MKNNGILRGLLIVQTLTVLIYTFLAFKNEGSNLFGVFLSNIQSLTWNGQFNLDFSCYLVLSALWIMWRNKFTSSSILIAVVAMIIGIIIFAPYLFWLLITENGDLKRVIVGER
jgi:hypothetical protein